MLLSYPVTSIRSVEVCQRTLRLHTDECLQFIDLTDRIKAFVNDANIIAGFVTTTRPTAIQGPNSIA